MQALRKHGVGVKPVTDTGTSWINDSKLDSLANTIQALAEEIASMREERDSIILSLKLEISELIIIIIIYLRISQRRSLY